ncbi:hypothetical protein D3C81_1404060 [compost metagenome]
MFECRNLRAPQRFNGNRLGFKRAFARFGRGVVEAVELGVVVTANIQGSAQCGELLGLDVDDVLERRSRLIATLVENHRSAYGGSVGIHPAGLRCARLEVLHGIVLQGFEAQLGVPGAAVALINRAV